jgi:hypothetical protein
MEKGKTNWLTAAASRPHWDARDMASTDLDLSKPVICFKQSTW